MPVANKSRVYQIKVTLNKARPPIWRRLLVPGSISLDTLHDILQTAMGWTDSHLHQFEVRGEIYGIPDPEFGEGTKNETRFRLDQALLREKEAMVYEYDFGDGWEHKIVLEKILPSAQGIAVPGCVGGARACPLEDCGGIWGYHELLKAIRDPAHPRHKEMLEWIGGSFDPEYFDVQEINRLLVPRKRRA